MARHLPVFGETLGLLAARFPGLRAVVPTVAAIADEVRAGAAAWPVETHVVGGDEKYDAIAAANVALAASGTIALELAIAGTPMVITYKANPLTAWLARRMIRVDYVCLVNLILDRPAVPELIQEMCRPDLLAEAVSLLLRDEDARQRQIGEARRAVEQLGLGGSPPSDRAAAVVLNVMSRGSRFPVV